MGEKLVAFDIGESQVKLVYYDGKQAKRAVCAPLPDNLVLNGEIISMDAMADFLRSVARQNSIPRTSCAVILPDSLVFTRNVDVPAMTDAQLAYNLPYEFKDYLRQEKSDYYFDYAVYDQVSDETGKMVELKLFACATLKKTIEEYRAMFRRAGFRLKVAIPEEVAYSAIMRTHTDYSGDTCFVDIGYSSTRMQFLRGDVFSTRRTINFGMRDLIASIADECNVDAHMAYEYLRSNYEGVVSAPASIAIYRNMAVEIMKAINFYNYNNREQMLSRIYLCGGGAAIAPLRDAIAETTNLEIRSASELLPMQTQIAEPLLFVKALGCATSE